MLKIDFSDCRHSCRLFGLTGIPAKAAFTQKSCFLSFSVVLLTSFLALNY
jgi:hypothetical protein